MEFNFTVRGDRIIEDKEYAFVEGNKGYYEAVFDFGEDEVWLSGAKICIVENKDKVYEIPVIGNRCILPEMLRGSSKIGVFRVVAENGESVRPSTNMIAIGVQDGASGAEINAEMSTAAEVWEKYLSDMEENRAAAEEAKNKAEGAAFSAEQSALGSNQSAIDASGSSTAAEKAKNAAESAKSEAEGFALQADGAEGRANAAATAASGFATKAEKAAIDASGFADMAIGSAESIRNMEVSAQALPPGRAPRVVKSINPDGSVNLHYLIPAGEKGEQGPQGAKGEQGERGATGPQGAKGDKGDSYVLTDADKTEIENDVSTEIEAELNAALDEIIAIQEELMMPDGDGVKY